MSRLRQYVAAVLVDVSCLLYGLSVGWASSALPLLASESSPLDRPITLTESSWLGSTLSITGTLGTPLFSAVVARWGCKATGYLLALPFIVAWVLTLVGGSVVELFTARALAGLGSAGGFALAIAYIRDVVEDGVRGALVSSSMVAGIIGLLCSYLLPLWLPYVEISAVYLACSVLFLVAFFWLPETPWYQLIKGRDPQAKASLQWFRRGRPENEVEEEFSVLVAAVKQKQLEDAANPVSLRDLVSTRVNRRALAIGVVVCANQHLCGIFALFTYSESIFREAGSSLDPALSSVVVGAVLLAGTTVSLLLVERMGRRVLMISSDVAMAVALATLGAYFYVKQHNEEEVTAKLGWLPLVCLSLYVVFNAIGVYTIPYAILSELFAPRIRDMATSVGLFTSWSFTFLVARFYPTVADATGEYVCYWFFSLCCLLGAAFIAIALPETKGKSLEEIQRDVENRRYFGTRNRVKEEE